MKHAYKNLRDCVFHNPLGLSLLPGKVRGIADSYIPYSTGIEFEATANETDYYFTDKYISLRNKLGNKVIDTDVDVFEQRFRLHVGEPGLRNLYDVCEFMKECFLLNTASGLHYHIDFSDTGRTGINESASYTKELNWVLKELDTWEYKGNYNRRAISTMKNSWVRIHPTYDTLEFRIGEMSFDYELIVKRILHLQSICKRIKKQFSKSQN